MVAEVQIRAKPDLQEIRQALHCLLEPNHVYELRAFPKKNQTDSGYFSDLEKLAQAAFSINKANVPVYITINPVNPDLLARAVNRVERFAKNATPDTEVTIRRWLPVDLDPKRPSGISSTEAEHQAALDRALECREWLRAQGWPDPIFADSGNGAHLLYPVALPNDQVSTALLMNCLKALAFRFDDALVSVDTGNFNAARIWKCFGTVAMKGDNIPERPHRLARILEVPRMNPVPLEKLQALATMLPPEPLKQTNNYRGNVEPFDLERWIARHGIRIRYTAPWGAGQKWVLEQCVWNADHTDKSAYIVQHQNGAIGAGCHHNSCQGKGWADLRECLEPGYKSRQENYASVSGGTGHHASVPQGEILRNLNEATVRGEPPAFPDVAWHPLLKTFKNWVEPSTEAPFEFVFSASKALVELVIGRHVYVQMGRRLYANSFQVNLAPAAEKKGTSWAMLSDGILQPYMDIIGLSGDIFRIVRGTGSAEGLLQTFMDEREETDEKGRKQLILVPVPGRRVITIEEELGYLLVKAHRDATANLREIMCQLWDGVDVSPPTRRRSLKVQEPFYSTLAMTTPETLSSRLEEDDILSGLLTRYVFYQGTLRAPLAWPDPPDTSGARLMAEELGGLKSHVQGLSKRQPLITPTREARSAWAEAYDLLRQESRKAATPALGRMLARIEIHVIKSALVYAMLSGHSQIEVDDLGRALALGSYWSKTAAQVATADLGDDTRRVEHKILSIVEQRPGVWVAVRELHQKLSGRVKAWEFHNAIKCLVKLGRLETHPPDELEKPKFVRSAGA